jgi:hypothetical protein
MNKQKRERAEQRAKALTNGLFAGLQDLQMANLSGRFNDQDNVRIRISKDRILEDVPDIVLRISERKIELGTNFITSASGKVKLTDERIWKTVSEKNFPKMLQASCAELAGLRH